MREDDADGIDQNQQRGEQRRPGDQRHPERHDAEFVARAARSLIAADQLAPGQAEENQPAGHLKIGHRDPERPENEFAEKDEPDRDRQARDNTEESLALAHFPGRLWRQAP